MPLPPSLAATIISALTWIRRHQRIHDFCLRTAAAIEKLPGGAAIVRTIQEAQRPRKGAYSEWINRYDTLGESDRRAIAAHIAAFASRPTFSIIMPVVAADAGSLRAGIESARRQFYPATELCIAVGSAAARCQAVAQVLEQVAAVDSRITIARIVGGEDEATIINEALALATGDLAVFFDPRNLLSTRALYEVAAEVVMHPDASIVFSDEDAIGPDGRRCDPVMKTGWNPEMMLAHDVVGNLAVVRRCLVAEIGGFRAGLGDARHHDLILRASMRTTATRIRHIPLVLHHSRQGLRIGEQEASHEQIARVVREHLERTGQTASTVTPLPGAPGWLEVRRSVPAAPPLVSVIVPTRDRADILEPCLEGLLKATEYPRFEVIIADNDSCEPTTLRLFTRYAADARVRILPCPGPFNYAAINNRAVAESRGEILLLLNNDVRIRHPEWLSAMVAQAVRPEVGAVGARLLYRNGTIQHAGVVLGVGAIAPVAGHVYERAAGTASGHLNHLRIARNVSAVTAACMAVRRDVFDEVGGFDERHLPAAFNDVDLCLKIDARGYQIIWTPRAELTHLESASRGSDLRPQAIERFHRDIAHMQRTWGERLQHDPYYGPNFHKVSLDYSLAFPPHRRKTWLLPRRPSDAEVSVQNGPRAESEAHDAGPDPVNTSFSKPHGRPLVVIDSSGKPSPRVAWTTNALIDRERRFAILFSEKSACTTAVIWFYHTLGIADEARAYSEWPHDYRLEVLHRPDSRFMATGGSLDDFTLIQVVRDPFERTASSFRHAVGTQYADVDIKKKLGIDVVKDGLAFQQFLDFLETENLHVCNPHHRMQSHALVPGRDADVVINISRQNLFTELNTFEKRMGMTVTDFTTLSWIHELQKSRAPVLADMGPDADCIRLTVAQARRGPWPKDLLTDLARRRIQLLYPQDISRFR